MELNGRARRTAWRLGRKLYCAARGEGHNRMDVNGEAYVQGRVLKAAQAGERRTVFDVGANLGEWTQSLIDQLAPGAGPSVDIWAFEPSPVTYGRLSDRFADRSDVHCIQKALSDEVGRDRLMMASATGGTNTLAFDAGLEQSAEDIVEIEKTTAAQFCEDNAIEHVHLLKCDTEGHDFSVVAGARPLLAAGRIDVMQFEYNHRWIYSRAFLKDVFDAVLDLPYTVCAMRSARIERLREWHPELDRFFEANYLIVHERALGWFDVLDGRFDVSNTYA